MPAPSSPNASVASLNRLRTVALVEGLSFLALLGIAMPLKYLAGMPLAVRIAGSVHGGLFILFLAALAHTAKLRGWSFDRISGALLASVIPFGTFVLDRQLRRDLAALSASPTTHAS
jgi:integral membrane protein